jgi:hypothetical protein
VTDSEGLCSMKLFENWFLIVKEGNKLMVFENRRLRRMLELKGEKLMEDGQNCVITNSIIL